MNKINFKKRKSFLKQFACIAVSAVMVFGFAQNAGLRLSASADDTEDYEYFPGEYTSEADLLAAGNALQKEMVSEGAVLLKNNNNALPLAEKSKVTILGRSAQHVLLYGGGSSIGAGYQPESPEIGLSEAIKDSQLLQTNMAAYNYFEGVGDDSSSYCQEVNVNTYKDNSALTGTFSEYDTAIIAISRSGSEGYDISRSEGKGNGAYQDGDHSLELSRNEVELINYANANFKKVILIINTGNPVELGFLTNEAAYKQHRGIPAEYDLDVDAAMVMGLTGRQGALAMPELLTGKINPSGRLADIWPADFKADPVWQNFGSNATSNGMHYVHYEEDIYYGYRYWETRGYEEQKADPQSTWYEDNVVYPFGYGISYTDFEYKVVSQQPAEGEPLTADTKITLQVEVKNIGKVPGKEVVQVYYTAPYYTGGIAKSHVNLVEFEKTGVIAPGETETVTVSFDARDMSSYDWSDANKNDFKGYELEHGDYQIRIAKNSHDYPITLTYNLPDDVTYATDAVTGNPINNLYDDVSVNKLGVQQYLSRDDFEGTFPTPAADKRAYGNQVELDYEITEEDDKKYEFYVDPEDMPTQATKEGDYTTNKIKLWHMIGRDYDDPLWDLLLNQLTVDELASLAGQGSFTTHPIPSIDKPSTVEGDGPLGFVLHIHVIKPRFRFPSSVVLAQTYNKELSEKYGIFLANEANFGNEGKSYSGIYAPGLNLHRSQFGGRNFEYYSEDPVLSGLLAAKQVKAMTDRGLYAMMKHFFLNDQESNRESLNTWASEQNMRENYAKAFEIVVKEGNAYAIMTGFNNIGTKNNCMSYENNVKLLREEWGFEGVVITDWSQANHVKNGPDAAIRGGTDIMMTNSNHVYDKPSTDESKLTATHVSALRRAAKSVLYAVANSNAMNGIGGRALSSSYIGDDLSFISGREASANVDTAMGYANLPAEFTYALEEGSQLPEGLTLNPDGSITGTPTAEAGSYSVNIVATEKGDQAYKYTPSVATFSINIYDKDTDNKILFNSTVTKELLAGREYSFKLNASYIKDGVLSDSGIKYALKSGSQLPEGLTLSEDGTISGTVVNPGDITDYEVGVVASVEGLESVEAVIKIRVVAEKIVFEAKELPVVSVGEEVELDIATATGATDIEYTVAEGYSLPEGLTLDRTNGIIKGVPQKGYNELKFVIVASAPDAMPAQQTFTLTVNGIVAADQEYTFYTGINTEYKLNASINSGNNGQLSFELKEGSVLPEGVTLLGDGTLLGNAKGITTKEFTVIVSAPGQISVEMKVTVAVEELYYEDDSMETADIEDAVEPVDPDAVKPDENSDNNQLWILWIVCPLVIVCAGVITTVIIVKRRKADK